MPIYAYRCANCGFEQDALQKMSDAPLSVCPNCGQPELKKQVTAAGFQLKGSGWYVTDFRNNTPGKAKEATPKDDQPASADAKPAEGTAASSGAGDSGKAASSDTKPAAAPSAASSSDSGSSSTPSTGGTTGSGSSGGTGKGGASFPQSPLLCF